MNARLLTKREYERIKQHIPKHSKIGRPRCDELKTLSGIVYVLSSGCSWRDLPETYGTRATVHRRFQELERLGVWEKIFMESIKYRVKRKKLRLSHVSVDSSTIPALCGGDLIGFNGHKRILGTKIHAVVDKKGFPIALMLSPANNNDGTKFIPVMKLIRHFMGNGFTKKIGTAHADGGYNTCEIREFLESLGIKIKIPHKASKSYKSGGRKKKGKAKQDKKADDKRWVVERFFAWLKNRFRRIRTRYEIKSENYFAFFQLASALRNWRGFG